MIYLILNPQFLVLSTFFIYILSILTVYLVYKFLISDYFVNKTNLNTFCLSNNKKKCHDNIYIIFSFLMNLPILLTCYYLYKNTNESFFLYIGCLLVFSWDYVLIGIILRLKYHFYENEEKNTCKRKYKKDFIDFGIRWGFLFSLSFTLFMVMFLIFHKPIVLFVSIIWFIMSNTCIFPDYLNRIWKKDIRSTEGNDVFWEIFSLIGLISLYLTFIL